jgi:2-methylcitrate dehydratase PrpD
MAVRGGAGFAEIDDSALEDPVIAALRRRVQIAEDSAMSALAPRLRPARVTLTLIDGRQSTQSRDSHRGDFQDPFAETEIRGKFRELAETVLNPDGAREAERAVDRCEQWPDVGELTVLLRRHSRP